jgi:UDP-GlcNAc:undecaprenyl-phosphate GlcNAc-1-phosphate transferase
VLYTGGVHTELAVLGWGGNLLLTVLWVTGITNAFNIIDVMDGMATGVACVAVAFLFLISAAVADDPLVPFMSVALAGSLLGFLRFNFPPARIFLGDTGSLFVGFIIAALSMVVSYSRYNQIAIVTPVVLLAVPIFDTFFVAVHRARRGIPFFRGSPDHFALRLAHSGLGVRGTVLVSYCVGAALGCVSLLIVFGPARPAAWMVACVGAGALLAVPLLSCLAAPTFEEPKESGAARRSGAPART